MAHIPPYLLLFTKAGVGMRERNIGSLRTLMVTFIYSQNLFLSKPWR